MTTSNVELAEAPISHAASDGRRWQVSPTAGFWVVVSLIVTGLLGSYALTPLYPIYQQRWGFSDLTLSVAFACYSLGTVLALLVAGSLSDRIGRRAALLPALAGVVIAIVVLATSVNVTMLLIGRALQGIFTGIVTGTAGAALMDLAPGGSKKTAALANSASIAVGSALGPLTAGFLVAHVAPPTVAPYLLVLGLLGLGIIGVVLMPETVERGSIRTHRIRLPRAPRHRGPFAIASLGAVVASASMALYAAFGAPIAHLGNLDGESAGGLLVFGMFAAIGVAQFALHRLRPLVALSSGAVACAVGWGAIVPSLAAHQPAVLIGGTLVAGIGCGLLMMGATATVGHIVDDGRRAETISLFLVIMFLGLAVPGICGGALSDAVGLTATTAVMLAFAICAGSVLLIASRSTRMRSQLS